MAHDDSIWYFAYGANMSRAVLARRGLQPVSSEAGWVDGYALAFSHRGLVFTEPAFANLEVRSGDRVHGVLHELAPRDLGRLDRIEGAEYAHMDVRVALSTGRVVAARAYADPYPVASLRPSRRYLRCVCAGAREFELPDEWIAWLEEHPTRYVPGLSELTTLCVGAAERLRRAGLRPELLRMRALGQKPRISL